jgi:hypothetical protein
MLFLNSGAARQSGIHALACEGALIGLTIDSFAAALAKGLAGFPFLIKTTTADDAP